MLFTRFLELLILTVCTLSRHFIKGSLSFIYLIYTWYLFGTFSLSAQYRLITNPAPKGGLKAPPVQCLRRAYLHLNYSLPATAGSVDYSKELSFFSVQRFTAHRGRVGTYTTFKISILAYSLTMTILHWIGILQKIDYVHTILLTLVLLMIRFISSLKADCIIM